jgi:ElaB/YqjD/DUF883 family membrane-anchored ribosome-binding protein
LKSHVTRFHLYRGTFFPGRYFTGRLGINLFASHSMEHGMSTTSTASENLRDTTRETAKDAREGLREVGRAASDASDDLQRDLQALRDDFTRLAQQVGDILSNKGNAAWRRAKTSVDGVVADAQTKGQEAATAMREVSDHFVDAVDQSLQERPYTTLAIAAGLGFIFGAIWRR